MSPRTPATLKTAALCCFIGGPVAHGFAGPTIGALAVAVGLSAYLAGLILAPATERRQARYLAVISACIGGWHLASWGWVRFGPALEGAIPLGVDPWVGRAAIAVEIAALAYALGGAARRWIGLLALLWISALPPIQRALFLGAPQLATLLPSLTAVAAMLALNQIARRARAPSPG